jgi:hypothetical protein
VETCSYQTSTITIYHQGHRIKISTHVRKSTLLKFLTLNDIQPPSHAGFTYSVSPFRRCHTASRPFSLAELRPPAFALVVHHRLALSQIFLTGQNRQDVVQMTHSKGQLPKWWNCTDVRQNSTKDAGPLHISFQDAYVLLTSSLRMTKPSFAAVDS